jgi:hypothetical protein
MGDPGLRRRAFDTDHAIRPQRQIRGLGSAGRKDGGLAEAAGGLVVRRHRNWLPGCADRGPDRHFCLGLMARASGLP